VLVRLDRLDHRLSHAGGDLGPEFALSATRRRPQSLRGYDSRNSRDPGIRTRTADDLPGSGGDAGQQVTIYTGVVWTLTGKLGDLVLRERTEWTDLGQDLDRDGGGFRYGSWGHRHDG
jgi:hypothetical protein